MTLVEEVAERLFDILWPVQEWDGEEATCRAVSDIVARAAIAIVVERCAAMAEKTGNFGDYQRLELTADYGQPKFDIMLEIAAAIRALAVKEAKP